VGVEVSWVASWPSNLCSLGRVPVGDRRARHDRERSDALFSAVACVRNRLTPDPRHKRLPGSYPGLVLSLRPAVVADIDALRAVAIAAYQGYVARIGRRPAPMTADYAKAVHDDRVWVAVDDDMVVGLAVLVPQQDHLLLDNIAVSPSAQGHGVGSRLLALAEEHARRHGVSEVRLYTNEAMTENLAYYPQRGYVETHRAEQDGFRRVFFRKLVTP
jgi:GNAT superfamily N-acetyltransferase